MIIRRIKPEELKRRWQMSALLPEWAMRTAERQLMQAGMVRVVNAEAALGLCKARGEGRVVLELTDERRPVRSCGLSRAAGRAGVWQC